ncbi:MAG: rhodanese-like domain-containing protein [Anaerolineales bacterium]
MAKKNTTKKVHSKQTVRKDKQSSLLTWIILGILALIVVYGIYSQFSQPANSAINFQEISVQEAYQKYQQGAFILDVRTPEEWAQGHIPNATLIPLEELENRINELPKDQEIVVICHTGNRSRQGAGILSQAGFKNIYTVTGGMNNWEAAGYPVVSGP